jgi:hypothetical protein
MVQNIYVIIEGAIKMIKKLMFKHELIQYAKNHKEGFTIYIDAFKIHELKPDQTIRYAIALTNNDNKYKVKMLLKGINKEFKGFIGGWMDKNTNIYYIDLVTIERNLSKSIILAKKYNQKCIYDLWKQKEIKII